MVDNTKLLEECVADLRATFPDVITGRRGIDMSCALVVTKKDENGNDVPDGAGHSMILPERMKRLADYLCPKNILRVQPPLNIRPENLKKGFAILKDSIRDYVNGDIPDSVMAFPQAGNLK